MSLASTRWMEDAACRRMPDLPWLADKGTAPVVLGDLMAEVCAVCPVREACGTYATTERLSGGYWAGSHRVQTDMYGPQLSLFGDAA